MTTPFFQSHLTKETRTNAFETLAQIQDILKQTNQTVMNSYAQAQRNQSDLLGQFSQAAEFRARETAETVAEYLKQQEAAANVPLWKTVITCLVAVVAIVGVALTGNFVLAGAMTAFFILQQMPTGFENGKPISVLDRIERATGAPKWVTDVISGIIIVASVALAVVTANPGEAFKAAVGTGLILTAQTGIVGNVVKDCGGSDMAAMITNITIGFLGALGGGAILLKTTPLVDMGKSMQTLGTFMQVGAQVADQSAEVANGVIKYDQYNEVAETAEVIGAMKERNRNLQSEMDALTSMTKQAADGIVQAQEDSNEQTMNINQAYDVIGRGIAASVAA